MVHTSDMDNAGHQGHLVSWGNKTFRVHTIQRIMVTAISGMLHTTATDVMEAHTYLPPVELLMHRVCHRAAIHLATLPMSHLLHKPVCACTRQCMKRHLSPIHLLLCAYGIKPSEFETLSLADRPPNSKCSIITDIATSREEAMEADSEDNVTLQVYTDRSGQDSMAGAAVVLFKRGNVIGMLQYHLGLLEQHTTFEAELVGILLGLWLVGQEPDAGSASVNANSQAAIQALNTHKPGPGGYLLDEIHKLSKSLCERSFSSLQLKISWISGHDGVTGNNRADKEAKAAAMGDSSPRHKLLPLLQSDPLPYSSTAAKQHYRSRLANDWRQLWAKLP